MTTGMGGYYHRARYYHPGLRRFLNQDIVLGSITTNAGLNRFAYADGEPVSGVDPFGLMRWSQLGQGAAQFAGGVLGVIGAGLITPTGLGIPIAAALGVTSAISMSVGVANIAASFSNDPRAVALENLPSNLSGTIGRAVAGKKGQAIAGGIEDITLAVKGGLKALLGKENLENSLEAVKSLLEYTKSGGELMVAIKQLVIDPETGLPRAPTDQEKKAMDDAAKSQSKGCKP